MCFLASLALSSVGVRVDVKENGRKGGFQRRREGKDEKRKEVEKAKEERKKHALKNCQITRKTKNRKVSEDREWEERGKGTEREKRGIHHFCSQTVHEKEKKKEGGG